jgi:sulfopyruvate decarboxylase TPP-binding subunit
MADKVINFLEISQKKREEEDYNININKHDNILDVLEEEYPMGGIIITIDEEGIGVAATVEDYETMRNAMVSAMIKLLESGQDELE